MLTEINNTLYVVKVGGVPVCQPQSSARLAESILLSLPPEQRALAEVVPVTANGSQLLLG